MYRSVDTRQLVDLISKYLKPYWREIILLLVSYFLYSILASAQPLVVAPVLDVVLGNEGELHATPPEAVPDIASLSLNNITTYLWFLFNFNEKSTWQIIIILGTSYMIVSLLMYAMEFVNYLLGIWIRIRSSRLMQMSLFNHILSLSMDFFNQQRTGEIISRLDKDTQATVGQLENITKSVVISLLQVVIYGVLLLRTNLILTFLIVLAGLANYGLTQVIRNPIRRRVKDQFNIMADTTAYLQEIIAGIRVVKSFVAEKLESARLDTIIAKLVNINFRYGIWKHVDEPVSKIISAFTNVFILFLAANELFAGRLTESGFFVYLYVGRSILGPLQTLTAAYNSVQVTLASGERIREIFEQVPTISSGTQSPVSLSKELRFENVNFHYDDGEGPVLKDLSVSLEYGKITALVGPSGGGKSTFTDLVMRFYDPTAGQILFDGIDLREMDLEAYRRLFGVVAQENYLFNDTVANNIAYARPDASQNDIEHAAKVANAHDFIMELTDGYKTLVGDRGVRLSGGQRQRIAIARAIVRKPQILILDEATSALDSESEQLVQEAIDRVIESTTAIVIAHRLSTIIHADKIILLDRGMMIDQGKHNDLLERSELYHHLVDLQFRLPAGALPSGE